MRLHSTLRAAVFLLIFAACAHAQTHPPSKQPSTPPQCSAVEIVIRLEAGKDYEQSIGNGLTFKIAAMKDQEWGWLLSLEDNAGRDYIYPANPPLRLNPSETLGRGYGDSARQSLGHDRNLRFLLGNADYNRLEPLVNNALWPYNAPDPNRAFDEYVTALQNLQTGVLKLKVLAPDIAPDDSVRSAKFHVELVAPQGFRFDAALHPHPSACPLKDDALPLPPHVNTERERTPIIALWSTLDEHVPWLNHDRRFRSHWKTQARAGACPQAWRQGQAGIRGLSPPYSLVTKRDRSLRREC
jgi:hypothetical protein